MTSDDRFSNSLDVTAKQSPNGSGHLLRRMCFACNLPKTELGGLTNKRTRMWTCAACNKKAEQCSSSE